MSLDGDDELLLQHGFDHAGESRALCRVEMRPVCRLNLTRQEFRQWEFHTVPDDCQEGGGIVRTRFQPLNPFSLGIRILDRVKS